LEILISKMEMSNGKLKLGVPKSVSYFHGVGIFEMDTVSPAGAEEIVIAFSTALTAKRHLASKESFTYIKKHTPGKKTRGGRRDSYSAIDIVPQSKVRKTNFTSPVNLSGRRLSSEVSGLTPGGRRKSFLSLGGNSNRRKSTGTMSVQSKASSTGAGGIGDTSTGSKSKIRSKRELNTYEVENINFSKSKWAKSRRQSVIEAQADTIEKLNKPQFQFVQKSLKKNKKSFAEIVLQQQLGVKTRVIDQKILKNSRSTEKVISGREELAGDDNVDAGASKL
jgi:hypothetical protein